MTYELKIQEEREEGRKEGRIEGRKEGIDFALVTTIRNLMETMNLTAQQAMEAMKIPASDRKKYAALV